MQKYERNDEQDDDDFTVAVQSQPMNQTFTTTSINTLVNLQESPKHNDNNSSSVMQQNREQPEIVDEKNSLKSQIVTTAPAQIKSTKKNSGISLETPSLTKPSDISNEQSESDTNALIQQQMEFQLQRDLEDRIHGEKPNVPTMLEQAQETVVQDSEIPITTNSPTFSIQHNSSSDNPMIEELAKPPQTQQNAIKNVGVVLPGKNTKLARINTRPTNTAQEPSRLSVVLSGKNTKLARINTRSTNTAQEPSSLGKNIPKNVHENSHNLSLNNDVHAQNISSGHQSQTSSENTKNITVNMREQQNIPISSPENNKEEPQSIVPPYTTALANTQRSYQQGTIASNANTIDVPNIKHLMMMQKSTTVNTSRKKPLAKEYDDFVISSVEKFLKKPIPSVQDIFPNMLIPLSNEPQKQVEKRVTPELLQTTLDRLSQVFPQKREQTGGNANVGNVKDTIKIVLKKYVDSVNVLLRSPVFYKITALDVASIHTLFETNKLYDADNEAISSSIVRNRFAEFLYVDITPLLLLSKNDQFSEFYDVILKKNINKEDTTKFWGLHDPLDAFSENTYMYILNFMECLKICSERNDRYIQNINYHLFLYVAMMLPSVQVFKNTIHEQIEDVQNNTSFVMKINELLYDKVNKNVFTFIKIRNDDDNDYNRRFKVQVNNDPKNPLNYKNALFVNYNDHNMPYYHFNPDNKKWEISPNFKEDWNKEIETSKNGVFEEYFDVGGNKQLTVKKYDDQFLLGPFTRVFQHRLNNKQIANQMETVINALEMKNPTPQPVFLIGYGASGAGKTSSLIYFNKGKDIDSRNGILMHLCGLLSKDYKNIRVKSYEFYTKTDVDGGDRKNMTPRGTRRISPKQDYMKFVYEEKTGFVLAEEYHHENAFPSRVMQQDSGTDVEKYKVKHFPAQTPLGEVMIHLIDMDRFVKATTNNPNSSRSHCLIFINFGDESQENGFDPNRTLIVGDFAGVENLFNCEDDKQLQGFIDVKKDDGSGKPFYSNTDLSLKGQEGGRKTQLLLNKKRLLKRVGGGVGARGGGMNCEQAVSDTSETFVLYRSERPVSKVDDTTNASSKKINELFSGIFKDKSLYSDVVIDVLDHVLAASKVDRKGKSSFDVMMGENIDDVLEYMDNYIKEQIPVISKGASAFQKVCNILYNSTVDYSGETVFKALLDGFEVSPKQIQYVVDEIVENNKFKDELKLVEVLNAKPINAYSMLKKADIGVTLLSDGDTQGCQSIKTFTRPEFAKTKFISHDDAVSILFNPNGVLNNKQRCAKSGVFYKGDKKFKDILTNRKISVYDTLLKGKELDKNEVIETFTFDPSNKTPLSSHQISAVMIQDYIKSVLQVPIVSLFVRSLDMSLIEKDVVDNLKLKKFMELLKKDDTLSWEKIYLYLLDEIKYIIFKAACKMQHAKNVCKVRRNEGVFINDTLKGVRDVIKLIMYEKNKDSVNIAPLFHEPCLPQYCRDGECFSFKGIDKGIPNIMFETIIDELVPNASSAENKGVVLKNLIVGVFCVLNLSKKANNPPPVPYINTNGLRTVLTNTQDEAHGKIVQEAQNLFDKLASFLDVDAKVKISVDEDKLQTLRDLSIISEDDMENKKDSIKAMKMVVLEFLTELDNISAASAMGTLQFVDMMAKYNTTDTICFQRNMKDSPVFTDLLHRLKLTDIVDMPDDSK